MKLGKLSLGQRTTAMRTLERLGMDKMFDFTNRDDLWDRTANLTFGQLAEINRGNRNLTKQILITLGFKKLD